MQRKILYGLTINNFLMLQPKCVVMPVKDIGWRPQMEDTLIAKCPTHFGS